MGQNLENSTILGFFLIQKSQRFLVADLWNRLLKASSSCETLEAMLADSLSPQMCRQPLSFQV